MIHLLVFSQSEILVKACLFLDNPLLSRAFPYAQEPVPLHPRCIEELGQFGEAAAKYEKPAIAGPGKARQGELQVNHQVSAPCLALRIVVVTLWIPLGIRPGIRSCISANRSDVSGFEVLRQCAEDLKRPPATRTAVPPSSSVYAIESLSESPTMQIL